MGAESPNAFKYRFDTDVKWTHVWKIQSTQAKVKYLNLPWCVSEVEWDPGGVNLIITNKPVKKSEIENSGEKFLE